MRRHAEGVTVVPMEARFGSPFDHMEKETAQLSQDADDKRGATCMIDRQRLKDVLSMNV
jgi:hypothetical protein